MRLDGLRAIVIKPDPFDLALTKLDAERLDLLPETIQSRISALEAMIEDTESHRTHVDQYLTKAEKYVMGHKTERLRAEVAWHTATPRRTSRHRRGRTRPKGHPRP